MFEKTAIIIGGSKGVGKAIAEALAAECFNLIIAARTKELLDELAEDLSRRFGGTYKTIILDIENVNIDGAQAFLGQCLIKASIITDLVLTAGLVMDQDVGTGYQEKEINHLSHINFNGGISLLSVFLKHFENQNKGRAWVFSSIAVDAPRGKNVVYGAAKSGLDYYCRAMHHKLQNSHVELRLVRLGYVDTDMIKGKDLLLPAVSAKKVADFVVKNLNKKFTLRYFPAYWRGLTFILKLLPRFIYYKLKF